jgi:hypothetical protein
MDKEEQSDARRREASRRAFGRILLLVLIGIAIFVAVKLASSMIGV